MKFTALCSRTSVGPCRSTGSEVRDSEGPRGHMIKIDQASLYLNINRFLFFKDEFLALFDQAFLLKNHWFVEVNLQNQDQIKFIFDPSGSILIGTKTRFKVQLHADARSNTSPLNQKHSKPSMHSYSCHSCLHVPACPNCRFLKWFSWNGLLEFTGVYRFTMV